MLCGSGFDSALGVLGFVEVSSFVVRVLLDFYFSFCLGFIARLLRWVFFYLEKKDLSNELVLNCDLDVLCLVSEKMLERKRCLNFECLILLSLGLGNT